MDQPVVDRGVTPCSCEILARICQSSSPKHYPEDPSALNCSWSKSRASGWEGISWPELSGFTRSWMLWPGMRHLANNRLNCPSDRFKMGMAGHHRHRLIIGQRRAAVDEFRIVERKSRTRGTAPPGLRQPCFTQVISAIRMHNRAQPINAIVAEELPVPQWNRWSHSV